MSDLAVNSRGRGSDILNQGADLALGGLARIGKASDNLRITRRGSLSEGVSNPATVLSVDTLHKNSEPGFLGKASRVLDAATGSLELLSTLNQERKQENPDYSRTFKKGIEVAGRTIATGLSATAAFGAASSLIGGSSLAAGGTALGLAGVGLAAAAPYAIAVGAGVATGWILGEAISFFR